MLDQSKRNKNSKRLCYRWAVLGLVLIATFSMTACQTTIAENFDKDFRQWSITVNEVASRRVYPLGGMRISPVFPTDHVIVVDMTITNNATKAATYPVGAVSLPDGHLQGKAVAIEDITVFQRKQYEYTDKKEILPGKPSIIRYIFIFSKKNRPSRLVIEGIGEIPIPKAPAKGG